MGNWHCIPSSCAEVVYQEYSGSKIRWRYPGENWQEIRGADDYSLQTDANFIGGQCEKTYLVHCLWDGRSKAVARIRGKVTSVTCLNYQAPDQVSRITYDIIAKNDKGETVTGQNIASPVPDGASQTIEIRPVSGRDDCGDKESKCVFTVFAQGEQVYTETRSVCPEVEKLPCRLSSEIKRIEINKLPFLEKVEVVPYEYATYRQPGLALPPLLQANDIPDECLNIYNNAIFIIPPDPDALKNPNATPFDSFIAQICSAPGCPPPEYQVLCDSCGCEKCPPGTRAVTCGFIVCCYNSDGISVQEIPASDYCGGGDCE